MTLGVLGGFGILGLLVFGGLWLLVRRQRRKAKEEGAAAERRITLDLDTEIIERQRDAATNRPDPHRPDDVLGRL